MVVVFVALAERIASRNLHLDSLTGRIYSMIGTPIDVVGRRVLSPGHPSDLSVLFGLTVVFLFYGSAAFALQAIFSAVIRRRKSATGHHAETYTVFPPRIEEQGGSRTKKRVSSKD
jgi:hypothetical protein